MLKFQIRSATLPDFATIIRLVHNFLIEMYGVSSTAIYDWGEAWQDFETRLLQTLNRKEDDEFAYPCAADHRVEIAEVVGDEAQPIGLIEASILDPAPIFRPVRIVHIHAVYVRPHYRRRGVGTALLQSAMEWGRQHQCSQAQLSVLPLNPARQLYRTLGFNGFGTELRKELRYS